MVLAESLQATYPDLKILFTPGYTDDAPATHGIIDSGVAFLAESHGGKYNDRHNQP